MRLLVAFVVFAAACSSHSATESTGATPTVTIVPPAASSATPTNAPSEGGALQGTFTSPSCGKRAYAREITFDAGGKLTARDLVSPCPPNAKCVWSGIVDREGTFVVDRSTVTITLTSPTGAPGAPFPTSMSWAGGVLREPADDGSSCVYERR